MPNKELLKSISDVRQGIYWKNRQVKDLVELEERQQLVAKNLRRKKTIHRTKLDYAGRIRDKREVVNRNKKIIEQLSRKEKEALSTLRSTLHTENNFDAQLKYDVNGCPKQKEFSERNHREFFQSNYKKTLKNSRSRPRSVRSTRSARTARSASYNSKRNSKFTQKMINLNNSYQKTPRLKGIYYDYQGVQKIKKNTLVKTSRPNKKLQKRFLHAYSQKTSDKINKILKKLQNSKKKYKLMLPVSPRPFNTTKLSSPRRTPRRFNIFDKV
ncbi:unnamed protein product [Moneuplotes crassus]|uniref:Uncharacterized protein n=1 Tax=Euplotes crassus TaxID=5936 RepID=A0AAD1UNJ9_EUPCR|nr:unnamed protein product [Moneuplotes crassus]